MSIGMNRTLSRRRFLGLAPALVLLRPRQAMAELPERSVRSYEAEVGIVFALLSFTVRGTISEEIDRRTGRYRVLMTGHGAGIAAQTESAGIIRDGRFMPTETVAVHTVRGRDNRTSLTYDHDRGSVEYHSVSYTFLLGRRRQADGVVRLHPGQHVDDLFSAELNFAANKLDADPDGARRITVVRRARPADEGPDEVAAAGYGAELVTVRFQPAPEPATGRLTAMIDLTGFSSWARSTRPARVAFGDDRLLASVESSLILGTTFTLRLAPSS
jgi:hypothetical protein